MRYAPAAIEGGSAEDLQREAEGCALMWRSLALSFYEPSKESLDLLLSGALFRDLHRASRLLDLQLPGLEAMAGAIEGMVLREEEALEGLRVEYNRLFVGPGSVPAPPYESVYRDRDPYSDQGIVMGPSAEAVEKTYQSFGIRPAISDLPDHIALEMEFMYFLSHRELAAWEAGAIEEVEGLRDARQRFLKAHISVWAPTFCDRLSATTENPLFAALAQTLREFVQIECRRWS